MSDAAIKTAPYPAYTIRELKAAIAAGRGNDTMAFEIVRRERRDAGDWSAMTPVERLRLIQRGEG